MTTEKRIARFVRKVRSHVRRGGVATVTRRFAVNEFDHDGPTRLVKAFRAHGLPQQIHFLGDLLRVGEPTLKSEQSFRAV